MLFALVTNGINSEIGNFFKVNRRNEYGAACASHRGTYTVMALGVVANENNVILLQLFPKDQSQQLQKDAGHECQA